MMRRAAVRVRWLFLVVALSNIVGCATQQQVVDAIHAVNETFRTHYESILAQKGTRMVGMSKRESFDAIRIALDRLGMQIESQDPGLGYLAVFAAAPLPLNAVEWRQATEADLPLLREIARQHVGMAAEFIRFEPEGLQVLITATALERPNGSEVSLTMRMREIAPPRSGIPRREYAPPTAVRIGLDKIWNAFDQEMRLRSGR